MVLLVAFEAMAVATAMPVAVKELHGLRFYAWGFSGFLVASLVGMVVAGEESDRRGPRLPLLSGLLAFSVGLVVAGTAVSMAVFILGRAVQGLGGGLVIVALYVVVARAYPESLRPQVFSAMSASWVLPSIVGPALAGYVATTWTWRLIFLAVPLMVVPAALPMARRLRTISGGNAEFVVRPGRKRLAVLAAAGAALLQYAGQRLALFSVVIAVVALVVLGLSVPRLLPRGTLRAARGLPTVVLMRGVMGGAFFGAEAFVPLMLITDRGLSPTAAGLALTGGALGWAFGSWLQGRPGRRTPRYRLVPRGCLLIAVGIACAGVVLVPAVPVVLAPVGWVLGGLGMGMGMSSVSVLLLELSEEAEQGANSAALQLSDALGSVIFVGLAGTLFAAFHQAGHDSRGFATIFCLMVVIALVGAVIGRRVRPSGGRGAPADTAAGPAAAGAGAP